MTEQNSTKNKKILLIRLSSTGDVIHTIPLANSLKDAGYSVTWLVSEKGYALLEGNPCVDNVILAPVCLWKKRGFSFKSFKEYISILQHIRSEHFDIAIDVQMMFKSLYWMLFCGAKRRIISSQARELSILGGNEIIPPITKNHTTHVIKNYLKYAKYLGANVDNIKVTLPKSSLETVQKVDNLLANINPAKPIIIFSPATTWTAKHWNTNYWKEVITTFKDECNIIFTGGVNDIPLINSINEYDLLNFAGKTNLMELAELLSRADIVISPDSGSAHLAWATQKPYVITIFTCTPLDYLGPIGENYFSVTGDMPCQPCFKRKCRFKTNACMNTPTPDKIISIVNKLLLKKVNVV